jgi:hypothetical protein
MSIINNPEEEVEQFSQRSTLSEKIVTQKVLKIFEGSSQYSFFEKEFFTLSKLNQGPQFPGIIKMLDA